MRGENGGGRCLCTFIPPKDLDRGRVRDSMQAHLHTQPTVSPMQGAGSRKCPRMHCHFDPGDTTQPTDKLPCILRTSVINTQHPTRTRAATELPCSRDATVFFLACGHIARASALHTTYLISLVCKHAGITVVQCYFVSNDRSFPRTE